MEERRRVAKMLVICVSAFIIGNTPLNAWFLFEMSTGLVIKSN
jgi:hypothetical protein